MFPRESIKLDDSTTSLLPCPILPRLLPSTETYCKLRSARLLFVAAYISRCQCLPANENETYLNDEQDQPDHGVTTVFVKLGNTNIELLHPLGEKSPIANFLKKRADGGIHHVCLEV
jgi:hypothetical protein